MADYRLSQSGDEVQNILDNAAMRAQLNAETERATGAETQLQQNINSEQSAREQADITLQGNIDAEAQSREGADALLQQGIEGEALSRETADDQLQDAIDDIEGKIPAAASPQNKLVDQNLMNSSIQTATAIFRGTYNLVTDMHLTTDATRLQIAAALPSVVAIGRAHV